MRWAAIVLTAATLVAGCSESEKPGGPAASETKPAPSADNAASLPTDVPIPIGLEGRKDSNRPGTAFFVVQGQLPATVPDAAAAIRKQALDGGWKALGEPAPNDTVSTLTFEKDARSLTITLVKVQNTVTSVNLLTGPK